MGGAIRDVGSGIPKGWDLSEITARDRIGPEGWVRFRTVEGKKFLVGEVACC